MGRRRENTELGLDTQWEAGCSARQNTARCSMHAQKCKMIMMCTRSCDMKDTPPRLSPIEYVLLP